MALRWGFDTRYTRELVFNVCAADHILGPFTVIRPDVRPNTEGQFEEALPPPGVAHRFYLLSLSLRASP